MANTNTNTNTTNAVVITSPSDSPANVPATSNVPVGMTIYRRHDGSEVLIPSAGLAFMVNNEAIGSARSAIATAKLETEAHVKTYQDMAILYKLADKTVSETQGLYAKMRGFHVLKVGTTGTATSPAPLRVALSDSDMEKSDSMQEDALLRKTVSRFYQNAKRESDKGVTGVWILMQDGRAIERHIAVNVRMI